MDTHAASPPPLAAPVALDGMPLPDRDGSVLGISKGGFHRMAYVEWGDPASSRVAVCVHGLSRQGRDFDRLAAAMAAQGWRVICPDLVGRGRSDWLANPEEYNLPQYAMDLTALIARLGVATVDWIGTSLGGLVGMVLAGQPQSPIRSLVINDIGPYLPWQALLRLGNTLRDAPNQFADLDAARAHFRTSLAPFGELAQQEWEQLIRHSITPAGGRRWRRLCDPDIVAGFGPSFVFNLTLWSYWDAIRCPTLVLRGEHSDLLLPNTTLEMARRGPRADVVEFAGCGHAPALMDAEQIDTILRWLHA